MLIKLTLTQKVVLHKFSNGKLCTDSTHDTNQYNFNLTSIVSIDEFREGYPGTFCISTKIDKEVIGCLTPNVFMSNKAPEFWNAWINTMRPIPQYHFLCKWHIDNNWRKNLNKISGSRSLKAYVYKTLPVLYLKNQIKLKAYTLERTYGKKNQRLDVLLRHLLKSLCDKYFERLIKLCNGG
ncbi:hypothetical protein AGLY_016702 [Aphis glycines]|uniref:MULE transposase domain-containing protein n=1 Tax=Aphis glycines TaxID=307491 RepID=A0A6G0SYX7_APHGL|nr:hypothetical protein AGLY_016702 [Aphis glycines]